MSMEMGDLAGPFLTVHLYLNSFNKIRLKFHHNKKNTTPRPPPANFELLPLQKYILEVKVVFP